MLMVINLFVGIYIVIVIDVNDCVDVFIVEINELEVIDFNIFVDVGNICENIIDGVVSVSVMGGMFLFFYEWSNGVIIFFIFNLLVGIYIVMVIDIVECMVMVSIDVNVFFVLFCFIEVMSFIFMVGNDGEVIIMVIGGIVFYIYFWSDG